MLISGFVIAHLLVTKNETYGRYIFRRWLRLFPVFIICVAFSVLYRWVMYPEMFWRWKILDYVPLHLFMLHGVAPDEYLKNSATALVAPSWSISLEWQFYLIAPAIVWLLATKRYVWFAGLCVLAFAASSNRWTIFGQTLTFPHDAFLPVSLRFFLLGVLSRWVYDRLPNDAPLLLVFAVAVAVAACTNSYVLGFWTFLMGSLCSPALQDTRSVGILAAGGAISYGVYLTHAPIMWVIRDQLKRAEVTVESGWHFPLLLGLAVVASTVVSIILYRYVEKPCIDLGKMAGAKKKPSELSSAPAVS